VNDESDNPLEAPKSPPQRSAYAYLARWLGVSFVVLAALVFVQLQFAGDSDPATPVVNQSSSTQGYEPTRSMGKSSETPQAPAPQMLEPPPSPVTSGETTFKSLSELVAYQKQEGYLFAGRFDDVWPATVVGEEFAMNEIRFQRANGTKHYWGRVDGYQLKLVRLRTPKGTEAIVLFRSAEKP
jgi:hypothetical protein